MEYSIVLTKAAFVHSKYLELYSGVSSEGGGGGGEEARTGELRKPLWSEGMAEAMAKTRAYVDDHRNCEDIAMQMVRWGRVWAQIAGSFSFLVGSSVQSVWLVFGLVGLCVGWLFIGGLVD